MADRDLYKLLGVARTASEDELKKAYRKLARDLHPDRNPGNKQAEERFKDVSFAYDILSDPPKRKLYDEFGEVGLREGFNVDNARQYKQWQSGGAGGGGPNWGSQFEDLFRGAGGRGAAGGQAGGFSFNLEDLLNGVGGAGGDPFQQGHRGRSRRGADQEVELTVDFVDALKGGERELRLADGHGGSRTIKARFPAGVRDGGKLRLRGQGSPGAEPGDLILHIRVGTHPVFRREEDDLHIDLPVTPAEAFRGAKVSVPTVSGDVTLKIPAGSQGGAVLRAKGKGAPIPGQADKHGDLYVHIQIALPKGDDEAVGKLLDEVSAPLGDVRKHIHL